MVAIFFDDFADNINLFTVDEFLKINALVNGIA